MGRLGTRAAKILLTISFGVFFYIHAFGAPGHLTLDWPDHALNHHLRGCISSATLAVVGVVLVFAALHKRWAWWTTALILLASAGGFWFAYATVEFGLDFEAERPIALAAAIIQTVAGIAGLGVAWCGVLDRSS